MKKVQGVYTLSLGITMFWECSEFPSSTVGVKDSGFGCLWLGFNFQTWG